MSQAVYVKSTQDGRKVEVIDGWLCLAGNRETDTLVPLIEHPNRQAISRAVPGATHMAGRIPLRHDEAAIAQGALDVSKRAFSVDPVSIEERFRKAVWAKATAEGVE
ncbi:MAG: hypothetical protein EPO09_08910 [Aquabacterium sp.]|uniref:hypothetical protein n=1 Tax=Aquabacterium sp. TaxID=1872578 RepID=UPI00122909F7|nr:hypothetical protein [Aquabacterium sp.]TAK94792.1 MAG: hypothetical protein EPO09_08910 [Aquabacterium sp.]